MANKQIRKTKFLVGIGMQVVQFTIITIFGFTLLDWSWFGKYIIPLLSIKNIMLVGGITTFLIYNIGSWRLIFQGLKED
jgi:hypothetical protein